MFPCFKNIVLFCGAHFTIQGDRNWIIVSEANQESLPDIVCNTNHISRLSAQCLDKIKNGDTKILIGFRAGFSASRQFSVGREKN